MFSLYLAGSLLLFAQPMMAQFNMYPAVSSSLLAASLNISSGCLTALNATVSCDQDLFRMVGNADAYYWDNDNATALCTSQCLSSAASWWSQSADACEDDQLTAYGRVYPAETVPGRFLDGLNIVCLTANTDVTKDVGINGTLITYTDVGGENSTVNSTFADAQALPDTPMERRQSSGGSPYCLVQSYDWVGSDIIRPDCDNPANANDTQCIDPTEVPAENSRIANLYPDSLLCSPCFLKMFYLRLASPYLPDVDQSDFMVEQWYDILDVCNANASMPELIVRAVPYYASAPGFSIDGSDNTTELTTPTADSTCAGRLIDLATLPEPTIDYHTQTGCDVIPPALHASTGDVIQVMRTPACLPNFNVTHICLPQPCRVGLMPDSTTCDQFAQSISTSDANVTTTQLLAWNPNLMGLCSNTTKQYVCVGAPGGTYIPPAVSNSTTNDGSQQRGGGGGSSTGSGGADGSGRNSTYITPGQTAPSPTQSGIAPSCTRYAMAEAGDGCTTFATSFGITLQALVTWNPVLGVGGANCATMLEIGYYYCLGVAGSTTTSSAPSSTSSTSSTPSPVQSGISPQCNKYAKAETGEYCSEFAPKYSITTAQLYTWNPILGTDGANCGTQFQAGVYYCVGVSATTTSATPTSTSPTSSTPSPVQSGINPQCTKYAEAVAGEYCSEFAPKYGITTAQLYTWNPVLGVDGANCGTNFQANVYYCVGAPAATPTTTVSAPGPTQTGITSSCNKFAQAIANDACGNFASRNGISTAQLYAWNTMLGSNGENCSSMLWAGNYYCVGVSS
ncbi:hypothetical protein GQ53DRAFT_835550 [Thozetella sp. PMI_491]|nr:hypothetical protein GQ53DRAFT_835550 [Thozetella sp. PMI_491]